MGHHLAIALVFFLMFGTLLTVGGFFDYKGTGRFAKPLPFPVSADSKFDVTALLLTQVHNPLALGLPPRNGPHHPSAMLDIMIDQEQSRGAGGGRSGEGPAAEPKEAGMPPLGERKTPSSLSKTMAQKSMEVPTEQQLALYTKAREHDATIAKVMQENYETQQKYGLEKQKLDIKYLQSRDELGIELDLIQFDHRRKIKQIETTHGLNVLTCLGSVALVICFVIAAGSAFTTDPERFIHIFDRIWTPRNQQILVAVFAVAGVLFVKAKL